MSKYLAAIFGRPWHHVKTIYSKNPHYNNVHHSKLQKVLPYLNIILGGGVAVTFFSIFSAYMLFPKIIDYNLIACILLIHCKRFLYVFLRYIWLFLQLPHLTPYVRFCSCQLKACQLLQHKTETNPEFKQLEKVKLKRAPKFTLLVISFQKIQCPNRWTFVSLFCYIVRGGFISLSRR